MDSTTEPSYKTQYIAAMSACMGALATGTVMGYSSPAALYLMFDKKLENVTYDVPLNETLEEDLKLSPSLYGWFSSTANFGAMAGGLLGGVLSNRWGRRTTMLISAPPFLLGWLLIALTQNVPLLIIGRILTGFCLGLASTSAPPYIAEMASPNKRGFLGSGFQVMITTGILYAFVLGALVQDWRWLAGLCGLPPVMFFILMFFAKESPVYLLTQGKDQEAQESLRHFRGKNYSIEKELEIMRKSVKESLENKLSFKEFFRASMRMPLFISLTNMFFQEWSGVPAVVYNLTTVFKASGVHLSEDLSSISVAVVQVLATIVGSVLMDRAGRKMLLMISSSSMAVALMSLGVYFYLRAEVWPQWTAETLNWLPLTSLIVFISTFSIGFGPVPWVMMGELFPENAREMAAGMTTAMNWGSAFIVTLIFTPLRMTVGDYGVYWIFGSICSLGILFSTFVVTETKGKTLQEITQHFERSSKVI